MRVSTGRTPVWLDFGVERHENGVAEFLTKGDIIDHPDGSITVLPNRSEANLVDVPLRRDGRDPASRARGSLTRPHMRWHRVTGGASRLRGSAPGPPPDPPFRSR